MGTEGRGAEALTPELRRRLLRLAYRYLGSVAEAEDAVQEACVKFLSAANVANPEAWLARVVTNAALDRLREVQRRRETYVGPWLPEPLMEMEQDYTDLEIDISFAVMRTLESLSPLERASFFLHDLFGLDFKTIGETLSRTPEAVRQLASRARQSLRKGETRYGATPGDLERLMQAMTQAVAENRIDSLKTVLAEDVELVSDGGGKVRAALRVLSGLDEVAGFLLTIASKPRPGTWSFHITPVNGASGLLIACDGRIDTVLALDCGTDGRIAALYLIRNPDKLGTVSAPGPAAERAQD